MRIVGINEIMSLGQFIENEIKPCSNGEMTQLQDLTQVLFESGRTFL